MQLSSSGSSPWPRTGTAISSSGRDRSRRAWGCPSDAQGRCAGGLDACAASARWAPPARSSSMLAGRTRTSRALRRAPRSDPRERRSRRSSGSRRVIRATATRASSRRSTAWRRRAVEIEVDPETAGLLDYAATCHAQSGASSTSRRASCAAPGASRDRRAGSGCRSRRDRRAARPRGMDEARRGARPSSNFRSPGLELDFGGIVKEYAADRVAALLQAAGVPHALVNLGGDIRAAGPRGRRARLAGRDPASAAAGRDPAHERAPLRRARSRRVATTSAASRSTGVRYGHVLDPRTGWPVRFMASASVDRLRSASSRAAPRRSRCSRARPGPAWLEGLGLPCLWVDVEGRARRVTREG